MSEFDRQLATEMTRMTIKDSSEMEKFSRKKYHCTKN